MQIEIDDDTVSSIFRNIIVQDYKMNRMDIGRLKRKSALQEFEKKDLEYDLTIDAAFEVLLKYYFNMTEAEKIIRETKGNNDE